ncbi:hypothetical protein CHLNCDRAFT_57139 [Chlorella variabilis]|uniref:GDP-D-glucose phosphorylase 1 n=1 Tax=Chlorella variabilis TaxID=554065 RepID=E1Z8G0_CHLVA|nr:hypothetical protein CHLNCDRAFT_57139 [Chlorella variabilis]EFN58342.1 hypothetical protein CHLNCDRAFT_57139 [Chlorella variabilis]|eukprot:XP_005850444.1 hypothetical protein CHLNCDRAFT_57139 [Chlorella variabilis]
MALTITHCATVLSLSQLAGEADVDGGSPAATSTPASSPSPASPAKGAATTPEKAVRDLADGDSLLPLYSFPSHDGFEVKRVRSFGSFGDLQAAAVPDVDDPASGAARGYASSDDDEAVSLDGSSDSGASAQVVPQRSVLDALLLGEWEDRAEAGLFRYDVTACPTKLVPGSYGFIAQCNEGRLSKKRPTEFRVDLVAQPYDAAKFNFTKALQQEVLFMFEPAGGRGGRRAKPAFRPAAQPRASPNLVYINVSPIEYGHVLLVPRALDALCQLVTPDTLLLALQFAREADNPYFRLAFNSLGAYGTINHLHFQAYYLAAPYAMERAPTVPLELEGLGAGAGAGSPPPQGGKGRRRAATGVRVDQLREYPVRSLVFEAGDSLREVAELVGTACQRLTAANVPHNLFIADCGARIFLFPNCFAEKKARGQIPEDVLETQVDPAAWEIAGHIVLKRQQDYEAVSQESAWRLLEFASCSEERFAEVARLALEGLI